MAKKVYEESKIAAIAEKIRSKTGGTETYTTAQMPSGVDTVYEKGETEGYTQGYAEGDSAGYERGYPEGYAKGETDGYNEGHTQGYTEGETAGIEAGKKAEYDAFWDVYQDYGERTAYVYAFSGSGWTDNTFNPKYDIIASGSISYSFTGCGITDLAAIIERNGIKFDTSRCTVFSYSFQQSAVTRLPIISTIGASKLDSTFYNASSLQTIEKLVLKSDGSQTLTTPFSLCSSLENIQIEGCFGANISFARSKKLTKASITSIVNALYGSSSGKTLTLSKTAVNTAFATTEGGTDGSTSDEWKALVATKTNWTITLS